MDPTRLTTTGWRCTANISARGPWLAVCSNIEILDEGAYRCRGGKAQPHTSTAPGHTASTMKPQNLFLGGSVAFTAEILYC